MIEKQKANKKKESSKEKQLIDFKVVKSTDLTDMTLLSLDIIGDYDITDEKAKTNADVLKDGEVNLADLAYYKQFISQDKILLGLPSEGE